MEDKIYDIEQLGSNWYAFYLDVKNNKRIDFDVFCKTFSNTYALLVRNMSDSHVEKEFLPILINASLFAHVDINEEAESKYKAALILTERMLNAVLSAKGAHSENEAVIYIWELRQGVSIYFDDVEKSIETLSKLYDNAY